MARPELGTKRVCADCGARYYDLNRDPIVCPKCGSIFEMAKTSAIEVAEIDDHDDEVVAATAASGSDDDADVISLEDADAEQASDIDVPDLDDDDDSDDCRRLP